MAVLEKREVYRDAVIDKETMTITEFDNGARSYRLADIIDRWSGVSGVILTIERTCDLPPYDEEG